jgi:hypothetical protein
MRDGTARPLHGWPSSETKIALVTEAPTVEALERRIALVVPDLLRGDASGPFEIELIGTRSWSIGS